MSAAAPREPRARGFVRSAPHKMVRYGAAHPTTAAAPYPPSASLRAHWPTPFDQGRSSACVPHTVIAATCVALAAATTPLAKVPSPRALYAATRALEQPGSAPLVDSGVAIVDCVEALATDGVEPMAVQRTPDGRYSDLWTAADVAGIADALPPNVGLRPTLEDDVAELGELVTGLTQLTATAPDFEAQVASAIANGWGISCGVHATPLFEAWFESPPANFVALSDSSGQDPEEHDGHGVTALDYRTEADGSLSFWLLSSWGAGGDAGGIWVTGACFRSLLLEAWIVRAVAASALSGLESANRSLAAGNGAAAIVEPRAEAAEFPSPAKGPAAVEPAKPPAPPETPAAVKPREFPSPAQAPAAVEPAKLPARPECPRGPNCYCRRGL